LSGVVNLSAVGSTLHGVRFEGISAEDRVGATLAGGGDFNGDGISDLLIGAPHGDNYGIEGGEVYLIYGVAVTPGDFDRDNDVDEFDLLIWQTGLGDPSPTFQDGDADKDGDVDEFDLLVWQTWFPFPTPGDFDLDNDVDEFDLLTWQAGYGQGTTYAEGDADGDGDVDEFDLLIWQAHYGSGASAVPEPTTLLLLATAALALLMFARRRR
jgi:hypothetical protein